MRRQVAVIVILGLGNLAVWGDRLARLDEAQGRIDLTVFEADVRRLLRDPELRTEIANALVEDTETMDSLADDIAGELSDELEGDPEMLKEIVDAAVASPLVKQRIVQKLVKELND